MTKRYFIFALIVIAIIASDQVTKLAVDAKMHLGDKIAVTIFFDLVYVLNSGGAWGVGSGTSPVFFTIVSIAALCLIFFYLTRLQDDKNLIMIALALVCGGAFGNLIDRIRLGAVIDFIYMHIGKHYWPAFNVADIAITAGAILLIVHLIRSKDNYKDTTEKT